MFDNLFGELLPIASIPDMTHLQRVIFVADGAMESTVNETLREQKKDAGTYVMGSHVPEATAVPLEIDNNLDCRIIINANQVHLLDPKRYHPFQLVSSLLEELFHVRIYSTAWKHRGYIYPPLSLPQQERDIFKLCTQLHDEHMVARWKTVVMGSVPLVDVEGGLSIAYPMYGNLVAPMLENASISLKKTIRSGLGSFEKAQLLLIVYRGIFEPLARNAGFQSATPKEELPVENNPGKSAFFQEHVVSFWEQIDKQLERSFKSSLVDMDDAVNEIVKVISTFLDYVEDLYC